MKKLIIGLGVIACLLSTTYASNDSKVIDAIIIVESSGNVSAVGDNGKAVGPAQMHKKCVDDVNRIVKNRRYTYSDRMSLHKTKEMMSIYLNHYGKRYERLTGRKIGTRELAAIWNGGPNGWKKKSTKKYAEKVVKHHSKL